ncbi:hypothetical protein NDI85_21245 [Halomicroarcula sp. S1AR25-4]|uniref:hypothetical protein n=1 Tax=Haloarcula sp. S1AR25-4 TaxID=2950538 RepID=UPI00287560E0|nr:hypothetical protein [Halomicroarcula sp. S1AR25-4]MDS0280314.1 hypothetical protein [Halomicroarcula sp. S1AR25-4]
MSDYDYDHENVVGELRGLADVRLSGSVTLDLTLWDDGDFRVEAYHTIDATYPFEAEAVGEEMGLPFYREQLTFETSGGDEGWVRHEVVRCHCGATGWSTIWSERVGGYTFDWPAPLDDDDDGDDQNDAKTRYLYPGRFA